MEATHMKQDLPIWDKSCLRLLESHVRIQIFHRVFYRSFSSKKEFSVKGLEYLAAPFSRNENGI